MNSDESLGKKVFQISGNAISISLTHKFLLLQAQK